MKIKVYCDCQGHAKKEKEADNCTECISLKSEDKFAAHKIGIHHIDFIDSFIKIDGRREVFINHKIWVKK